jgi:hypothetical protein
MDGHGQAFYYRYRNLSVLSLLVVVTYQQSQMQNRMATIQTAPNPHCQRAEGLESTFKLSAGGGIHRWLGRFKFP